MTPRAARRLPGVQFESRLPPIPESLPRMDVAVFVGFASSGPLHLPVAVDDPRRFLELFGEDPVLAWDVERGEPERAHLGAVVRGFFRNGGRRCWVIRVARRHEPEALPPVVGARANRFPVPALLRLDGGDLSPATLVARSEGSWSDDLAVSASLASQPVGATIEEVVGGEPVRVRLSSPEAVSVGDLLRLSWRDAGGALLFSLLATVAALEQGQVATLSLSARLWLGGPVVLPAGAPWSVSWQPRAEAGMVALPLFEPPQLGSDEATLLLAGSEVPPPGTPLRLLRAGGPDVWMVAGASRLEERGSPPQLLARVAGPWVRRLPSAPAGLSPPPGGPPGSTLSAERLRVDLWTRMGARQPRRLTDLGLGAAHPRWLQALPTDARLFNDEAGARPERDDALRTRLRDELGEGLDLREHLASLWSAASTPRWPLAADDGAAPLPDALVPLAMPVVADGFLGAEPIAGSAPERDGLLTFDERLFLDPALGGEAAETLMAQAEYLRWQSPEPRALEGIHAALPLEEATLIAAPDAVHRRWSPSTLVLPRVLPTPLLRAEKVAGGAGGRGWRLRWDDLGVGVKYLLQESSSADFSSLLSSTTLTTTSVEPTARQSGSGAYRLRALLPRPPGAAPPGTPGGAGGVDLRSASLDAGSAWSAAVVLDFPPPDFAVCAAPGLAAPAFLHTPVSADDHGSFLLEWTMVAGAARYVVEESEDYDFQATTVLHGGAARSVFVYGRAPGSRFYRVRGERAVPESAGGTGPWSDALAVSVAPPLQLVLEPPTRCPTPLAPELIAVQCALLRLAAARGDLVALLSLPSHYRECEAERHVGTLRGALVPVEERVWSYGALYHPWVVGDEGALPPDGMVGGVIAGRALSRGAWIAAANEPAQGIFGLAPAIDRAQHERLARAQINVIRQEPHGVVMLSEDTLSLDDELIPLHVRRLLILLRRLALRHGSTWVFEPNSDAFRRSVQRGFEVLLERLYQRGAFAGSTPATSYQVVVDDRVNPPSSVEAGQLVVELKVAPAAPLEFLTVRLVQGSDRSVAQEVR